MKKRDIIILVAFFVFAYLLRVQFLPKLSLTFGYDQARDAYTTQQILDGDLKVLGPPASTPGLYHGVFYYYFLAAPYFFGQDPINAAYWTALFNAAVVFIVFFLTFYITKQKRAGFLASFLYAISFEATQYATWLSNPTIAIWTVPLMYLGLWAWVSEKKRWGPFIAAIGLGLSVQAEIFLLYHAIPLAIWLFYAKKRIKKKEIITFFAVLGLSLSSLIISEVKFGFRGISGFKALLVGNEANIAYAKSLGDYLLLYFNQIGRIFAFNSYPSNIGYGGAFILTLAIIAVVNSKKTSERIPWGLFLATWLFSHITVVTVGGTSTPFLMVGIGPAVSVLLAITLSRWWKGSKAAVLIVLGLLIFSNLSIIYKENPKGSTLFAIQKDMLIKKQRDAVDYIYTQASGEPFSVNSLTSPLWINIVWAHLFENYGQPNYGYLPCYSGRDQVGQLSALPTCEKENDNHFLILEPMGGIPAKYLNETLDIENAGSVFVDEAAFGELRVQKRKAI